MPVFLFKKHQNTAIEAPAHKISKSLAVKICAAVAFKMIAENAIQLLTEESFAEIKARLKPFEQRIRSKQFFKLPIRDWRENLLLTYPHRSQESKPHPWIEIA